MTIATCYYSTEGVVLGSDSREVEIGDNGEITVVSDTVEKIYEVGDNGSFGVVAWDKPEIDGISIRDLVGRLTDRVKKKGLDEPREVDESWRNILWEIYEPYVIKAKHDNPEISEIINKDPETRTTNDNEKYNNFINDYRVCFCLAGCSPKNHRTDAFMVEITPENSCLPKPVHLLSGRLYRWGVQSFMGTDLLVDLPFCRGIFNAIIKSGITKGSNTFLEDCILRAIKETRDNPPLVGESLINAIDLSYYTIYCTIETLRFYGQRKPCGGRVDIAAIPTGSKFTWVRKKEPDHSMTYPLINPSNPSSSIIFTPSASALSAFEPGSVPQIT